MPTASSYLSELSCSSDLIIRGQIQRKTAYLIDDETFAYTDYDFLVNDVLKNSSDSSIRTDQIIQITRPGGLVKLEDQVVRYEDRSFKPLTIGDEYLLFLKYLPSANGYIPARFDGDFLLQGNKFFQDSIKALPPELRNSDDSQFLLGSVQSAVSIGCTN